MNTTLFKKYDEFENGLIRQFRAHPFYRTFLAMPPERFVAYLLQVGFTSGHFVRWYETAKQGMVSEKGLEVVRHILRDEIPSNAPTHQDERLHDLNLIGITTAQVRNVKPSSTTKRTVERFYELIGYPQDDYDLRVLITLRMAGEVLVAEQYDPVVRYMKERLGIPPAESRFFEEHRKHDLKKQAGQASEGHTDAFDELLAELISDEDRLAVAKDAAKQAFEARYNLHNQFVPSMVIRQRLRHFGWTAVALVIFSLISYRGYQRITEPSYWEFVSSLDLKAQQFFLNNNIELLEKARRVRNPRLLSKIGTIEADREIWGEGP